LKDRPDYERGLSWWWDLDAFVLKINDLAFCLNCLKEGSSFKLEGREFQSSVPAEVKLFLK